MHDFKIPEKILFNLKEGFNTIYSVDGKPSLEINDKPVSEIFLQNNLKKFESSEIETRKNPFFSISRDFKSGKFYIPGHYINNPPYEGRPFIFGLYDCYTLISDWYEREFDINMPWNVDRDVGWWNQTSLYTEESKNTDFVTTNSIQKGTIIISKIGSLVPNHAGVCISQNEILQHHYGRFSYVSQLTNKYLYDSHIMYIHRSLL